MSDETKEDVEKFKVIKCKLDYLTANYVKTEDEINQENIIANKVNSFVMDDDKIDAEVKKLDEQLRQLREIGERSGWTLEVNKKRLFIIDKRAAFLGVRARHIVADAKEKGVIIKDVYDLVNTSDDYSELIEVLIKHLSMNYHIRIKEGIVRALTTKSAKGKANKALIAEYNKTVKDSSANMNLCWIIGNAIKTVFTEDDVDDIISIVKNPANGWSRHMFIIALAKSKQHVDKVENAIIQLLDEPLSPENTNSIWRAIFMALGKLKSKKVENLLISLLDKDKFTSIDRKRPILADIIKALGQHKSIKAKDHSLKYVNHPNKEVVKEVKKYLDKISKL